MRYKIAQYLVYQLQTSELVVQTEDSLVFLKNRIIYDFLKKYENADRISSDEIKYFFGEQADAAKNFLINNKLINVVKPLNFDIQSIFFVTNDPHALNYVAKDWELDQKPVQVMSLKKFYQLQIREKQLFVFFINGINPELVRKIYAKFKEVPESYALLSYFYHFDYYIDNIYSQGWENPNFFDHMGFIQSKEMNQKDNVTYQQLVDMLYENDRNFGVCVPMPWRIFIQSIYLLQHQMLRLFSLKTITKELDTDDLLDITHCDLKEGKETHETAIFWELTQL